MASLRYTLCTLVWLAGGVNAFTGGFYVDNGLDQSVYHPKVSKRERREMQQEILSVLGLNHRPKPHSHETDTSAPRYMLNLYKNLIDQETGELRANESSLDPRLWHDDNSLHAIHDADIIMSFVNHGKKKRLKRCWRKYRKRFPPTRGGDNPTNWPVCKLRNNSTNIRSAHERLHLRHEKDRRFWFDVSEVPVGETLLGAELRIYKEPTPDDEESDEEEGLGNDVTYTIAIYEILDGADSDEKVLHLVDSVNITTDYEGWIYLNVSGPASQWLIFPENNMGLYLSIQADGKGRELHPKELHLVGARGRHDHQPFMVAFFKTPQELHIRRTRAAGNKRQRNDFSYNEADVAAWNPYATYDMDRIQKRSCQKRTLYVSFKELGWQDWIIAPDGYAAFYCSGECSFPLNAHMNATNHAIVQTLVHLMNPFQVPKPCCAPTKLTAISVLYFDDNSNVILKKYRNMVVKSCGCH